MELPIIFSNYKIFFLAIIALLFFFVIGFFIWRTYSKSLNSNYKNISNNSDGTTGSVESSKGPIDLYIFYATWCPHCKTALPKWKTFSDNINGTIVNGSLVTTHTIDCTNSEDPNVISYLNKYAIKGFPTVKGVIGGKVINFDSRINENTLQQFVEKLSSS
jgi:thiol-disulfide isomerase/thioredoxin